MRDSFPTPAEMIAHLDTIVHGQSDAKERICNAVHEHYWSLQNYKSDEEKPQKPNVLIMGPSGSGKTFIVKTLATFLELPFLEIASTDLAPTSYKGKDLESAFNRFLKSEECSGDRTKAELGIVFLDEIDKRAKHGDAEHVDLGLMLQQALLKPIESGQCGELSTDRMLFIAAGAFEGLPDVVRKRVDKQNLSLNEAFKEVTTDDLINYGMIKELIGRLLVRTHVQELNKADYLALITKNGSFTIAHKRRYFESAGVDLEFLPESLEEIAEITRTRNLGVRGLAQVINECVSSVQAKVYEYAAQGLTSIRVGRGVAVGRAKPMVAKGRRPATPLNKQKTFSLKDIADKQPNKSKQATSGNSPAPGDGSARGGAASGFMTEGERAAFEEWNRAFRENQRQPQQQTPDVGHWWRFLWARVFGSMRQWPSGTTAWLGQRRILQAALLWFLTYCVIVALGYSEERKDWRTFFRIVFCREECGGWHLLGIFLGAGVFAFYRFRTFFRSMGSWSVNLFAVGLYCFFVAIGARGEIFSFNNPAFMWMTLGDFALLRNRHDVTVWTVVGAALAMWIIFSFVPPQRGEPGNWGPLNSLVRRRAAGRGPTETAGGRGDTWRPG